MAGLKRKRFSKKPSKFNAKRFKKTTTKRKTFKKKTFKRRSTAPEQYGSGHWRAFGKGPSGPRRSIGLVKKLETMLPPNKVLLTQVNSLSTTAGVQNFGIISSLYDPYDLYNCNGGQPGGVTATKVGMNKVILRNYSNTINFTNQTNAHVKLTFYCFINRRDSPVATTGAVTTPTSDPITAWNVDNTGTGSLYDNTLFGATPFDSQLLCKSFKCIKSTEFRLAEGETGEYVVKGHMNKIFDMSQLYGQTLTGARAEITQNFGGFKGLTTWVIAVLQGSPTDNNNSTVGSTIAKVDFISTQNYTWQQIESQQATCLQQAAVVATAAGQSWNEGSGASQTIATI